MAEQRSSTALEEITPEERRWRMSQVYELLIALAREKRTEQQRLDSVVQVVSNNNSGSDG